MEKLLLIDANNLLHRVYWVHKSYAKSTSVPHLFLNSIKKCYSDFTPDVTYLAWDSKIHYGETNFRKTGLEEYKQNRPKEHDDDIYQHEGVIKELCSHLGLKNIYPGVLEADDVIYWLCNYYNENEKVVVSADQDLLQLVNDTTTVFSPIKKYMVSLDNFEELSGIQKPHFIKYKALIGDKSDNIPGIPRVGDKTAKKLLNSDDDLKSQLSEDNYQLFESNMNLVDLSRAQKFHPDEYSIYEEQVEKLNTHEQNFAKFENLAENSGLSSILNSIDNWKQTFRKSDFIQRLQAFLNEKDK